MVRENLRTEFIVLTDLILFEKQFVNILTFFLFLTFGKSGEGDKTAHLAPSLPLPPRRQWTGRYQSTSQYFPEQYTLLKKMAPVNRYLDILIYWNRFWVIFPFLKQYIGIYNLTKPRKFIFQVNAVLHASSTTGCIE